MFVSPAGRLAPTAFFPTRLLGLSGALAPDHRLVVQLRGKAEDKNYSSALQHCYEPDPPIVVLDQKENNQCPHRSFGMECTRPSQIGWGGIF
jgi:hypothetical protein